LRLRRLFQYLCISERDVLGQLCARGRKADGAATADAASAVDEGIEHDAEELMAEKVMPAVNAQISRSNQDFRAVSRDTDFRKTGT
jgi:hypothetical protein